MFSGRKSSVRAIMAIQGLILAMIVTQCTVSNGAVEPTEPAPIPTVEVEPTADTRILVYYLSYFETATSLNPEQVIVDQFEAAHPHIDISRQPLNASPYTVISFLRQNPSFTVVLTAWADRDLSAAMAEGKCLNLSQVLSDAGLERSYPDTFMALGEYEGRQYFLPAFYSWFAIYYNKQIFDQYNLEPPETWQSFLEVSQALLDHGVTPLVYGGGETEATTVWFDYLDMRLNGPEFHAALIRGEERYDDPRVRDVFETWKFLVQSGYIAEETWTLSSTQSRDSVLQGEAAMMLMSSTLAPDELGSFRFPIMDPTLPVGEIVPTLGYLVPANVQSPVEATEFLTYLGSPEAQAILTRQFAAAAGFLPVNQDAERETFTPEMQQGLSIIQAADHIRQPYYASFDSSMTKPIWRAFYNIMRGEDYEEQLVTLEEERQRIFD